MSNAGKPDTAKNAKDGSDKTKPSLFARLFGWSAWSKAIQNKDFGAIIDLFVVWFIGMGFLAILFAGIAAGLSGSDGLGPEVQSANPGLFHAPAPAKIETKVTVDAKTGVKTTTTTATAAAKPQAESCGCLSWDPKAFGLGFRVFSLGLLLAGACTCLGWLFGLLFGVPRAVAQITDGNTAAALDKAKTPGTVSSRKAASKVNTNLEDISDWLTKTLVGVGLVELQSLPKFLGDLAFNINRFGFNWGDHGQLLALIVVLYFVPGGFWLGYVGTRTMLTGLFDYFSGGNWQEHVASASKPDNLEIDATNTIHPARGEVLQADAAVLSKPMQMLDTEEEIVAWAAAQARRGNRETARVALENVLGTNPANDNARRQLVKVYIALKCFADAVDYAADLPDLPPKMLALLYASADDAPQRALDVGTESLKKEPKLDESASYHIWRARAYAQQYAALKAKPGDPDPGLAGLEESVKKELEHAAKTRCATAGKVFKAVAASEKDQPNKELEAFKDTDWFKALLKQVEPDA